jgi:type IV pilus assembly protein PilM
MNQTAVVEAIKTLRDNLGIKGREVATAISGHSVIIKKIKVPPMTPEELEEQIPWEAEHHIPFSKDDVEIDYQLVGSGGGAGTQMELLLVAAKKEVVSDYSMVIREAKLQPMIMDVAAFTIQNAYEANYTVVPEEAVAVINVGATLCNINIVAGGTSAFTRDVTVGGNAFTEIGSTGDGASEVVPQEVEAVIASVADSVAGKFQRSLDFYLAASSDANITKIFLCGGSAKVPALQRALEEKARTAVEVMDPFRKIAVDEHKFDMAFVQQHAAEAAVAVGLALRRPGDKP